MIIFKFLIGLSIFIGSYTFAAGSLEILGTSTLHDWEMKSDKLEVELKSVEGKIERLNVSVLVGDIKSDSDGLNKNAYKALEVDKHDTIYFTLLEHDKAKGTLKGEFKVRGAPVVIELSPSVISDDEVSGSFKVKMSEFGVKPPSFMLGAMKTGDEVEIRYSVKP